MRYNNSDLSEVVSGAALGGDGVMTGEVGSYMQQVESSGIKNNGNETHNSGSAGNFDVDDDRRMLAEDVDLKDKLMTFVKGIQRISGPT